MFSRPLPRVAVLTIALVALGVPSAAWGQGASSTRGAPSTRGASSTRGEAPGKDTAEKKEEPEPGKPRVPWKGTSFNWSNEVTTSELGVGGDTQSPEAFAAYVQRYWVVLNYFVVDKPRAKVRLATAPGFDVEITNSDSTTFFREPLFRDLNLTMVSNLNLVRDKRRRLATVLIPNLTVFLPTSKVSASNGTYVITSPRVTLFQMFPLLGTSKQNSMFAGASLRWDHRFSQASTGVNDGANLPDRNAGQMSGIAFAEDALTGAFFLGFWGKAFGNTLQAGFNVQLTRELLHQFDDCVDVPTVGGQEGCTDVGVEGAAQSRLQTGFGLSATYFPMAEWGFGLGFQNGSNQLGPDGLYRTIFFGPAARFSARIVLSLDAIYEVMTGPRRISPFIIPG